jgi:hypothetical protein
LAKKNILRKITSYNESNPIKGMPAADLAVLVIQKDDVERLIILPDYDSCGGDL